MADQRGIQTMNFAGIPSLLQIPEIRPRIVDIYRRQKMIDLLTWLGRWDKVGNDKWYTVRNQQGFYSLDTTGATVTNSGSPLVTVTGLVTAQSGKAIVGDLVIMPNGQQARIQTVVVAGGLDTITLQSTAAGTPNLTLVAGGVVRQFSNGQEEGSEAPTPRKRGYDTIYNQAQIFRKSYAATDIMKARASKSLYVEVDGQEQEYKIGAIEMYLQHRAEVATGLFMSEMSDPNFTNANPTVVGVNGRGVQTTRGVIPTINNLGSNSNVTTPGTITNADILALIGKIADVEGPDHYVGVGSKRAIAAMSFFLKGLGSANTSTVRIELGPNDTLVNFMVERFIVADITFDLMEADIFNTTQIYPTANAEAKSIYFLPVGEVPALGSSGTETMSTPWVGVNYLPVIEPGIGNEKEAEVRLGALAPTPTNGTNVDQSTWCTIAGIETPKPEALIKMGGVLA